MDQKNCTLVFGIRLTAEQCFDLCMYNFPATKARGPAIPEGILTIVKNAFGSGNQQLQAFKEWAVRDGPLSILLWAGIIFGNGLCLCLYDDDPSYIAVLGWLCDSRVGRYKIPTVEEFSDFVSTIQQEDVIYRDIFGPTFQPQVWRAVD